MPSRLIWRRPWRNGWRHSLCLQPSHPGQGREHVRLHRGGLDGGAIGGLVLMLTTFDLDDYVYRPLRAGARGFRFKDTELPRNCSRRSAP